MDWVRIYESHNAYEWGLQKIRAVVDPWGDDRAEFSRAVNTAAIVASNSAEPEEGRISELIKSLRAFLCVHNPQKFQDEDRDTLNRISETMAKRLQEQGQWVESAI